MRSITRNTVLSDRNCACSEVSTRTSWVSPIRYWLKSTRLMSPLVPSTAGALRDHMIGRPSRVWGSDWDAELVPSPIMTADPPVPTGTAMVKISGMASGVITHTEEPNDSGSIRANIARTLFQVIVLADWPDSLSTVISAG